MTPDFWFLAAKIILGLALIYYGWTRPSRRSALILFLWNIVLAADTIVDGFTNPDGFRFRGDTLGVDVSLTWVAPALALIFAAIAFIWMRRLDNTTVNSHVQSSRAARLLITPAIVIVPIQVYLLRTGSGQDTHDVIGVLFTMAQWFLISAAIRARSQGHRLIENRS